VKTDDLTRVPLHGRANAVFVGSTEYTGIRSLLTLTPRWLRLARRMKRAPGFCAHYYTYRFPFTIGQVVLFEEMDQLLRFARSKEHRKLMSWVVELDENGEGKNAKGGYIRLYEARPDGTYVTGSWSNDGATTHVEHFSPLGAETEGPLVRRHEGD
jgi:hypothetical protein